VNYKEAKKRALEEYQENLKRIEFAKTIAGKIEPNLPDGWECRIELICFNLRIRKGAWGKDIEKHDANEFKLVCKLVEMAYPDINLKKDAFVNKDGKIIRLSAEGYYEEKDNLIQVQVHLYYPTLMPNCKITWEEQLVRKPIISDECLGIGGK